MIALIIKMLIALLIVSCSNIESNSVINDNIEYIENNLIEFTSPAGMLDPDSSQLANPKSLEERMAHYNTPGVSIAVVNDNKLEWAKGYGLINNDKLEKVNTKTIFEAASTSKLVTAVLLLNLVQEGLIDLDSDVNAYLKSWKIPDNEYTETEKVTLRRLLTHKAGLPTTNYSYDENLGYPSLINVLNGELPAINKPAIPEIVPGTQWQYSNIGYNVIEQLIEDISGKPFSKYAEELIFKPLKMDNSTFLYPLEVEKLEREAMPHDAEGNSLIPSMHFTAFAHAGLTTTPTDLAKFTIEIMKSYKGKSNKILTKDTAQMLFNVEFELDPRMYGIPLSEGLGVLMLESGKNLIFAHPGSNLPGLNCWLIGWPNKGNAIIVMTNGAMGEVLAMEIISTFNQRYNKI